MGQAVDVGFRANGLRQQILLGDAAFVDHELSCVTPLQQQAREVPLGQRIRGGLAQDISGSVARLMAQGLGRNEALWLACRKGGCSMTALAWGLGLSASRISRLISRFEAEAKGKT